MSEIAEAHSTENSFTKFIFENSLYSEETFSVVGVISFVSLNLYSILCNSWSTAPVFSYNQINKQPENLYVNCRVCCGYFTHLAETSLF